MLTEIRHILQYGRDIGRLSILPNTAWWMPKFRFAVLPYGDIYESKVYKYRGMVNPERPELKFIFENTPEITRIADGEIDIKFSKRHLYDFDDVKVRLHKLSEADAALRREADKETHHLLTEKIKSLEHRVSMIEKIR